MNRTKNSFTASVPTYDYIELRREKTIEGLRTAETKVVWKKHENGPMSELLKFEI